VKVEFDKSFLKSLDKIQDSKILRKIEKVIISCELSTKISEIQHIKKLTGFSNYYRIKLNNYRIGFELIDKSIIRFIIITHRKDIYKRFP
jgi:mRNA interferase RelE/StbE